MDELKRAFLNMREINKSYSKIDTKKKLMLEYSTTPYAVWSSSSDGTYMYDFCPVQSGNYTRMRSNSTLLSWKKKYNPHSEDAITIGGTDYRLFYIPAGYATGLTVYSMREF